MISNENSILVRLKTSFWSAYKKDKQASAETARQYKMDKGTVSTNKKLLPKFVLKDINDTINNFKTYFQKNTLPYNLALSTRILPISSYFDFKQEEASVVATLRKQVQEFEDNYDKYVAEAQAKLGDLFNPQDYPSKLETAGNRWLKEPLSHWRRFQFSAAFQ